MDIKLLDLIYELKETIDNDERVIFLSKIEKELENDLNVISLSIKKNRISEEFKELLRFSKEFDDKVKTKQKELYLAKKELDELEIVKKYNKAYQAVRMLYEDISKELFSELNFKRDCL